MKINTLLFPILCLLLPVACKVAYSPTAVKPSRYDIKGNNRADSSTMALENLLKPYRDSLIQLTQVVIGEAAGNFIKERPGGSLGNLIADAMLEETLLHDSLCHGSIFNYGGIRLPDMMKGPILNGKLLELLPFDNELVILHIDGQTLSRWLNLIAQKGGWPVSLPGLFTFNHYIIESDIGSKTKEYHTADNPRFDSRKMGVVQFHQNKLINDQKDTLYEERINGDTHMQVTAFHIHPDSIYHIATNDYVANGGDNCEFLNEVQRTNTTVLIRDLVTQYIRQHKIIQPDNHQRLQLTN
jgi:2',3'-cyclic-nucleotide 2'-phosphodiesterase (5'-nucleotidase family)